MDSLIKFAKKHFFLLSLLGFGLVVLSVGVKMNLFRYSNFEFGKFDLGNMTQMVWNTLNGRFMYLTDYFGTNLPRWAMSHVDPILVIFVPLFALYQHPLTLVFSQLVLIVVSALIIYKIGELEMESKLAASIMGFVFLFYPALGYIIAWTGFHGVTAAIPFFLGTFYVFEKMYKEQDFSRLKLIVFWFLVVLTMMGKEELPLFIAALGFFIILFRPLVPSKRFGWNMVIAGLVWFALAFFVIIPSSAHYRVEGYIRFAESLNIDADSSNDVAKPNYFLSRYEGFGESYSDVVLGMIKNPHKVVKEVVEGDKPENMRMTFQPLLYFPLLYPPIFAIAIPELFINYSTTEGGIGVSEIFNHRISMIIPVLILATMYGISFISKLFEDYFKVGRQFVIVVLSFVVLGSSIYTTFDYQNPVYLWLTQAVEKRLGLVALAEEGYEVGEGVEDINFDPKDARCSEMVVKMIPAEASVSGPDYLGAHLSMRETYALFPALYNSTDYVVVDVFSSKVVRVLGVSSSIVNRAVGNIVKDENYKLISSCGNLFVFRNVGPHGKTSLLPIQERFGYAPRVRYLLMEGLYVVDFDLPEFISKDETANIKYVFIRDGGGSLDGHIIYTTFVNTSSDEKFQIVNLPSFGLSHPRSWSEGRYYIEQTGLVLPDFVEEGTYEVFIGVTDSLDSRSVYLGNVEVL